MSGEKDLTTLLANMNPVLAPDSFVFASVADNELHRFDVSDIDVFVREDEGLTLILRSELAGKYDLDVAQTFARITLQIHSSLEAVGLTAVIATKLAAADISANVVAGYYHDHVYVADSDGAKAIQVLRQ